jgi:transcriptional regulator with XRE-family HTH domain
VKRTPEDDYFASEFGALLEKAYRTEKSKKITDQMFAESIGVERPQLRKYFLGEAMPSVRTVAMAHKRYGITVPYAGVAIPDAPVSRKKIALLPNPIQLRLPFSLEVSDARHFEVELKTIRPRKYELRIRAKRA